MGDAFCVTGYLAVNCRCTTPLFTSHSPSWILSLWSSCHVVACLWHLHSSCDSCILAMTCCVVPVTRCVLPKTIAFLLAHLLSHCDGYNFAVTCCVGLVTDYHLPSVSSPTWRWHPSVRTSSRPCYQTRHRRSMPTRTSVLLFSDRYKFCLLFSVPLMVTLLPNAVNHFYIGKIIWWTATTRKSTVRAITHIV